MDYDKLIHCLKCCARVDAQNVGCDDCGLEYCGEECQQLCGTPPPPSPRSRPKTKVYVYLLNWGIHGQKIIELCETERLKRRQKTRSCGQNWSE